MAELLLHPNTQAAVDAFCRGASHALLITGMPGAGKRTLGRTIVSQVLGIDQAKLEHYPYIYELGTDETPSISIDSVRSLQDALRLKTPGKTRIRRALLIYDAPRMTREAQNALLKSLEEPPADTVIILTASSADELLPTITSRMARLWLKNPTKEASVQYFSGRGYPETEIMRAYNLSEGAIGLMHALLDNQYEHPLAASVEQAKAVIGMSRPERLAHIDTVTKDKDALLRLLFAIERVAHAMLLADVERNDLAKTRRHALLMQRVLDTEAALQVNANQKLVLTDLFLNI